MNKLEREGEREEIKTRTEEKYQTIGSPNTRNKKVRKKYLKNKSISINI